MTDTIRYEIAPIFNASFLLADPMLRKHIVQIGILEYEKALLEIKDLEEIEKRTQTVINKIQKNREKLVVEYESMMKCIRSNVISN
tara:strand:+ start:5421 stop:5678 length:258 start_codon:yes stop_codon:yes gene_type:complete